MKTDPQVKMRIQPDLAGEEQVECGGDCVGDYCCACSSKYDVSFSGCADINFDMILSAFESFM